MNVLPRVDGASCSVPGYVSSGYQRATRVCDSFGRCGLIPYLVAAAQGREELLANCKNLNGNIHFCREMYCIVGFIHLKIILDGRISPSGVLCKIPTQRFQHRNIA